MFETYEDMVTIDDVYNPIIQQRRQKRKPYCHCWQGKTSDLYIISVK